MGLYHCSVGTVKVQRYIAVSIFTDGFNSLDNDLLESENGSNTPPLYTFRPWFCRQPVQDNTPKKSNRNSGSLSQSASLWHEAGTEGKPHALDLVNDLIKHPGKCLRDDKDSIDFEAVDQQTLSSVALPALELNDSWILIDSPAKMKACIAELEAQPPSELAFDVECYNKSKYSQLTCLLQLCTDAGKTFVIDTLAPGVWDVVAGLASIFADPSIVKVGHCIGGMDTFSLHRDFGIYVVNAFDTYEAAQVLKLPSRGLDSVCAHYGLQDSEKYFALKETYQAGDWHVRPLTPAMLQYARYDVHFLLPLRKLMMRDLTRALLFDWKNSKDKETGNDSKKLVDAIEALKLGTKEGKSEEIGSSDEEPQGALTDEDEDDDALSFSTSRGDLGFPATDLQPSGSNEGYFTPAVLSRSNSASRLTESDGSESNVAGVSILRLQDKLLRVLSQSQHRCKALWYGGTESHMKNALFESLISRASKGEIQWTSFQTKLYDDLVKWRSKVASQELQCLVDFLASLDFLAAVAWKRPRSVEAMRRISYRLPSALEDNHDYVRHIIDLVNESLQAEIGAGSVSCPSSFEDDTLSVATDRNVFSGTDEVLDLFLDQEIVFRYEDAKTQPWFSAHADQAAKAVIVVAIIAVVAVVVTQRVHRKHG